MEESQKDAPVSIKIISVLFFIVALLFFFFSIFYVYNVFSVIQPLEATDGLDYQSGMDSTMLIVVIPGFVLFFGVAILSFFIGRSLWLGKNWARIAALIFSLLIILLSIVGIIGGKMKNIFGLIVFLIVARYLWFDERTKNFLID